MFGWRRLGRWGAAALLVVAVTGCASDNKPVEHPEGSVALVVNQPASITGGRAIASQVSADQATIEIVLDDQRAEGKRMSVGDSAVLAGVSFDLVAIDKDSSDQPEGETGGDQTTVWILPTGE
jgi:hypothetical protein